MRLMEEATHESEHKGWCDTELGTNKQTREDKADQVRRGSKRVGTLQHSETRCVELILLIHLQLTSRGAVDRQLASLRQGVFDLGRRVREVMHNCLVDSCFPTLTDLLYAPGR